MTDLNIMMVGPDGRLAHAAAKRAIAAKDALASILADLSLPAPRLFAVAADLQGANTIGAVAGVAAKIALLGTTSVIASMVALGDPAVIATMAALSPAQVIANMAALAPKAGNIATLAPIADKIATAADNAAAIATAANNIGTINAAPQAATDSATARDTTLAYRDATAALLAATTPVMSYASFDLASPSYRAGGLTTKAQVIINVDERNGNLTTLNYFDGWELQLLRVLTFTPQMLFANGERGFYYDASDRSTMWQDRAFATPVTASGQPVSIMLDKASARPSVAIARRNAFASTDEANCTIPGFAHFLSGIVTPARGVAGVAPPAPKRSVVRFFETTANTNHYRLRQINNAAGSWTYSTSFNPALGRSRVVIYLTGSVYALVDLASSTVVTSVNTPSVTFAAEANGFIRVSISKAGLAANSINAGWALDSGVGGAALASAYAGDTTKGILISGEQLEAGLASTSYQFVGNNVGGWVGGNVAACDTDAKRPLWMVDGALRSLLFDGVDDILWADSVDLLNTAGVVTIAASFQILTNAGNYPTVMSHGDGTQGFRYMLLHGSANVAPTGAFAVAIAEDAASNYLTRRLSDTYTVPRTMTVVATCDPQAAAVADRIKIEVNGYPFPTTLDFAAGVTGQMSGSALARMALGALGTGTQFANIKLYAALGINRALSASDRLNLAQSFGAKAGLAIYGGAFSNTYNPAAADFWDTTTPTATGAAPNNYLATQSFARVIGNTASSTINVTAINAYTVAHEMGVYVDDAWFASFSCPPGLSTTAVHLDKIGAKKVEVWNSMQQLQGGVGAGAYVTKIESDQPWAVVPPVARASRIYMLMDSIGAYIADPQTKNAHAALLRQSGAAQGVPASVMLNGVASQSWKNLITNTAGINALVANIVSANPTRILLELGVNDFQLAQWTPAAMGAQIALFLDALRAAMPALPIDLVTPIVKTVEAANALGFILGDYRTAIANAATGRGYVTVRDGSAVMTTAGLGDGLHPNNGGMVLFWTAEKGWLAWA